MIYFSKLGKLGRLGNQMFQYSALLAVANKLHCNFQIDFTATELSNAFNLSAIDNDKIPSQLFIFEEEFNSFDRSLFEITDNTDIIGFFQSFKYFEDIQEQVKKEFRFKQDILFTAKKKIEELKNGYELVSLHVRRGDYVTRDKNIFTQDAIKICQLNYYLKAIASFEKIEVKFAVFSDDISWCKKHIKGDNIVYIEGNNSYVDLCMMSLCDHNIISSSTFSWWGAWLNSNPQKKIVAPKRWFGLAWGNNTKALYPKNWIVIGSFSDYIKYWLIDLLSFLKIRKPIYEILIRFKYLINDPQSAFSSGKIKVLSRISKKR